MPPTHFTRFLLIRSKHHIISAVQSHEKQGWLLYHVQCKHWIGHLDWYGQGSFLETTIQLCSIQSSIDLKSHCTMNSLHTFWCSSSNSVAEPRFYVVQMAHP